jgi:hypothetical protein
MSSGFLAGTLTAKGRTSSVIEEMMTGRPGEKVVFDAQPPKRWVSDFDKLAAL